MRICRGSTGHLACRRSDLGCSRIGRRTHPRLPRPRAGGGPADLDDLRLAIPETALTRDPSLARGPSFALDKAERARWGLYVTYDQSCLVARDMAGREANKENLMNWVLLVIAGLLEVGWAIGLKYTHGFTRLWPSVWTAVAIVVSMVLLGVAMRSLPAGTAYAVWTGIGTVGTVILGIALLGEPATPARVACIVLILAGIVGLKVLSPQ